MDKNPIAIDLFCGAGGLTEGLINAGFDVKLSIDSDPNSYFVYTWNHKNSPAIWNNIEEIKKIETPLRFLGISKKQVSLIAGGPPCQGFSNANRRTNTLNNSHNKMVKQYLRIVKEVQPPYIIIENVEGLRYFEGGKIYEKIINKLEKLDYTVKTQILDAADYGVPQHRKRLFIVASAFDNFKWPSKTHGPDAAKPWVTVSDAIIGDLPSIKGGGIRESKYFSQSTSIYQRKIRRGTRVLYDHITSQSQEDVKKRFSLIPQGSNLRLINQNGLLPKKLKIIINHNGVYRRLDPFKPSITITNISRSLIIHPIENRILSLREAARLQSFYDDYRFPGPISRMQQAIGNAVPPLLARAVGKQIIKQVRYGKK